MATYPHSFLKLTWGGTSAGDYDIWTNSLNFAIPSGSILGDPVGSSLLAEDVAVAISSAYTQAAGISARCKLRWVKWAPIGIEGRYIGDPDVYDYDVPVDGTSGLGVAVQTALAVSFLSNRLRAPGKDGRLFLPSWAIPPDGSSPYIPSNAATAARDAYRGLINAINLHVQNVVDPACRACIISPKLPNYQPITKVRAGRVPDTIRLRRNKIPELYTDTIDIEDV